MTAAAAVAAALLLLFVLNVLGAWAQRLRAEADVYEAHAAALQRALNPAPDDSEEVPFPLPGHGHPAPAAYGAGLTTTFTA